jgi:hypothetical protein
MLAQIEKAREALNEEYRGLLAGHEQLLRLTLNEAEALAWETDFPQLVFPALAAEKVAAVAQWERKQQALYRNGRMLAFAA